VKIHKAVCMRPCSSKRLPNVPMASITKRRRLGLLALTKPYLFLFFKSYFKACIRIAFDLLVFAIAERLLFAESACTPCISLSCFYFDTARFCFGRLRKSFVRDHLFHMILFYFFTFWGIGKFAINSSIPCWLTAETKWTGR